MPIDPKRPQAFNLPIRTNREIRPETFLLSFECPTLAETVVPGQFLMISFPHLLDPLLPRPLAVFNVGEHSVEVLYKRVGKGTHLLSRSQTGDRLRVLGPLGNGFTFNHTSGPLLVVAGGIGIASVYFLVSRILQRGQNVTLLYGAVKQRELIPMEGLRNGRLDLQVATEDGGEGFKGNVCELLGSRLEQQQGTGETFGFAFACGPPGMLEKVAHILNDQGLRAQFSLESRMACGYGVCQGCVVQTRNDRKKDLPPHRKVCTEGPIFDPLEVRWETLAKCL